MITVNACCRDCSWRWKPRKTEGPERDLVRARAAATNHARTYRGHFVESKSIVQGESRRGGRLCIVDVEITRRETR